MDVLMGLQDRRVLATDEILALAMSRVNGWEK